MDEAETDVIGSAPAPFLASEKNYTVSKNKVFSFLGQIYVIGGLLIINIKIFQMFCINFFWSRSLSEPSFYRSNRSRILFSPGVGAEKKISGAGAEENWLGSSTLI